MPSNQVRIIGGLYRRRLLRFPSALGLRPTADRVRETLFNWLGQELDGKACLDLFAGSGALGFEAASRGASRVVMVERDPAAAAALRENAAILGAGAVEVRAGDALQCLPRLEGGFDVIFLDPPFRQNWLERLLPAMPDLLAPGGRVYVESEQALDPGPGWRVWRAGRAGQAHYCVLEREEGTHA